MFLFVQYVFVFYSNVMFYGYMHPNETVAEIFLQLSVIAIVVDCAMRKLLRILLQLLLIVQCASYNAFYCNCFGLCNAQATTHFVAIVVDCAMRKLQRILLQLLRIVQCASYNAFYCNC